MARSTGSRKHRHQRSLAKLESLEARKMLAAHIVGSTTSYATIQAAVNAAVAGQTITVDAGTYDETVTVNKSLTIDGAEANVDARNARGAESIVYATQTVFYITGNDVTINGFTIEGDDANIGAQQGAGVLMAPSIHGTQVLNNIIQNNVTGIYLSNNSNTDQCLIQHNLIQNNFEAGNSWTLAVGENGSRGIYTDGTVSGGYLTNVLINANTIENTNYNGGDEDEGIIALQALTAGKQFNITISNNYIADESKALLATNVTNLAFIGNTCTGLTDGSSGPVRFEGDANNVDIQYNTIDGNSGPGVAIDSSGVSGDSSGFVIDNNNIYNNDGIGVITQASVYDGPLYAQNDWWGSASGPGGDGPGTGQAVWGNGNSGHGITPSGLAGGDAIFSPWATALINTSTIPVPATPTGLTASISSSSALNLSWTAPMSTATSQIIERSTDGINFTVVAVVPPLLNSFTDTGLSSGVTYIYRIIAANATGNSAPSSTASMAPPVYAAPEPANGITETTATSNSITLQWNTPYYPYGIANYTIYRNGTAVGTSTTTSFTDTGLSADTAYTYTITTTDTTGAVSAPTAPTSLVSGHSQFLDGNFQYNTAADVYDPTTTYWTYTGQSALEYSGGIFGTVSGIPNNGTQFAVIQGANNGQIGSISQTMNVATTGAYTISLYAAMRSGFTAEPITISLDGTVIGTITPTSNTFAQFTIPAFSLYAGTHTFTFSGTTNTGDHDSFIDDVSLNLAGDASLPATPVLMSAAAASATSVDLNWSAGGFGATSYSILRSTDGVNWTTVASGLASTVTSYTNTGLSASTTYFYEVKGTNAIGSSAASNIISATTPNSAATVTPLSSLTWNSATSGYLTVQKNASVKGNTLTLNGVTYSTGLGTSAESVISYSLNGKYNEFSVDVGVDAEEDIPAGVLASVDFEVLGDGRVLFDSGDLGTSSSTIHIAVPVTGVQTLTLVATNGVPGIAYDHADWAGAQLLTNPTAPAAPTGLTAVALGTSSIQLTWAAPAGTVTGYTIERSTDGINFTTLATGVSASATSWTDTTAAAGTTYYYLIQATNVAGTSPNSTVASATTIAANAITTNLSSLTWTSATAGYGSVQKNQSVNGNAITLKGVVYPSGISANAVSTIVYNLGGNYSNFMATIGIDDEENAKGMGSVDFQVIGDGTVLFDSGVLTNASPAVNINVSVAGVHTLTLVANNGVAGTIDYDHADWAGARLISTAAQALVAPTNLVAASSSATAVSLTWSSTAPDATGFTILRSTDGVNFTTLVTNLASTARSYTDSSVAAATQYYYEVIAVDGGLNSPASNVASATTFAANAITTNLSSLTWTSATAGYGSVQKNLSVNGNAITLKGVVYPSGLSANAVSSIVYNLGGNYTNFMATVGIDDEENGKGIGSVDFQVIGDGTVLFDSGVLTNASPAVNINVSVAGVHTLTLVANNGVAGTIDYDQADWAGARLISVPAAPAAPTGLTAVTSSASQINLSWAAPTGANAATGYLVQRSTDGVNFTTIATLGAVTTYFDTNALSPGTQYTYQIVATDAIGNSAASATASATTLSSSAVVTNLSSIPWVSATTGYASVQLNSTVGGNTITLRGVTYATGIGTHAVSNIVYNLDGGYTNFISDVGVDDEENGKGIGSVDFQVIGDGKVLFDSGILTNASPIVSLDVNVTGVQTLTLVATNGVANSIDYDHSDWAGARLVSISQRTTNSVTPAKLASSLSSTPVVEALPTRTSSPFSNTLIGNVSESATVSETTKSIAVTGSGAGTGGKSDSVDFASESLAGNGTIICHIGTAQTGADEAGLMIRESSAGGSKEVAIMLGQKSVDMVTRSANDAKASVSSTKVKSAATAPTWMEIVRKGNTYTVYDSTDGKHWTKVGSTTINMGRVVQIGLADSSGNAYALNDTDFSHVKITS